MSDYKQRWGVDSYKQNWRDTRHGLGIGAVVVIVIVVLVVVVGGVLWASGVILSGPIGKGNIIKQNNSAGNQIEQQGHFEDLANAFPGYLAKIKVAKQVLATDTKGTTEYQIDQTNVEGLQQTCIDVANEFNAASAKTLAKDWKAAGLPATLDLQECT